MRIKTQYASGAADDCWKLPHPRPHIPVHPSRNPRKTFFYPTRMKIVSFTSILLLIFFLSSRLPAAKRCTNSIACILHCYHSLIVILFIVILVYSSRSFGCCRQRVQRSIGQQRIIVFCFIRSFDERRLWKQSCASGHSQFHQRSKRGRKLQIQVNTITLNRILIFNEILLQIYNETVLRAPMALK